MRSRGGRDPITLREVAREAAVSEITVSRVIRGKGPISDDTRRKVMSAIAKTGYVPNRLAGSLASAVSDLVGVIVPSISNSVFPDVLRGIDDAISKKGLRAVIGVTGYDEAEEARLITSLAAWRPAALILTGVEHDPDAVQQLRNANVFTVEIMDTDRPPLNAAVGFSHEAAAREMARHLLKRGYRRVGYVGHDIERDRRAERRYVSFRATLLEAGVPLHAENHIPGPSSIEMGRYGLESMLHQASDLDAVYFSNDDLAIGGIYHCLAAEIRVPQDLAIAGFNGLDLGQHLPTPLTSVLTLRRQIGRTAGELALARLAGATVPTITDVGYRLIEGETT